MANIRPIPIDQVVDPRPFEKESSTTQLFEELTFSSDSSDDDEDMYPKEYNLTAEAYNSIFLNGFREVMVTVFDKSAKDCEVPHDRKKPAADLTPSEAYRQGYNLAIAVFIVTNAAEDKENIWRTWVMRRWKGLL